MQSADYVRRLESVLKSRVEKKKHQSRPRFAGLRRTASSITGAAACFFVLKAAALATGGTAAFAGPLPADPGLGARLHHWVAGVDPVSSTLASALRPAMAYPVSASL